LSRSPDETAGGLADVPGLALRIGVDHRVALLAAEGVAVDGRLAQRPALAGALKRQPCVIACPGTRWCSRALADTHGLADRIRTAVADRADADLMIAISGCPNGCVASAVADIGIFGARSNIDGRPVERYTLVSGGGCGASAQLARPVAAKLGADEALSEVVALAAR
jgi:dissimilatory sulfite reductase (desulfoviridin) alpha/beta subunit